MDAEQHAQGEEIALPARGLAGRGWPFALWALLVASFLAVVVFYVSFAEEFIFKIYELEQIGRSHGRSVSSSILDYEDYLRADPASLRIRGRVVSALIVNRRFAEAIDHASQALKYAAESQRPVVWLISGRAHLAAGDIDLAAYFIRRALDASPESGEAHYLLARVAAARGQFVEMAEAYARVRELGAKDSSQEYGEEWKARSQGLSAYANEIESGEDVAQRLYEHGDALERLGRLEEAMDLFVEASDLAKAPAKAIYWAGVRAEREGDRAEALMRYEQAARGSLKHPNAAYAHDRIRSSS